MKFPKPFKPLALALALTAGLGTARAQSPAAPAGGPEAALRKALTERLPELSKIDEVTRSPIPGLWEVRVGTDIFYTDEAAQHLIVGSLIETETKKDLTAERQAKLTAFNMAQFPWKDAIAIKQGNGSRKLVVFSDPNCGFCKRFERDLVGLKDATIYTVLYPVLGPDSLEKSKAIWCAADPAKAWRDYMVEGRALPSLPAKCDTSALDRNLALGRKHRVDGTPLTVFDDGSRRSGYVNLSQLEPLMAAARGAAAKP